MNMAIQPVLRFHISAGFRVGIIAAGQHSYKQIGRTLLTCDRIIDGNRIASPVNLNSVSGFVLDTHGRFGDACPLTVFVTELRTHVGRLSGLVALAAVFLPQ